MAVFAYKALRADATAVQGTLVADSPRQVRDQLRERGLTVQDVREGKAGRGEKVAARPAAPLLGRRHRTRVVAFVRELSTLLGVGVPLVEALQTLAGQERGRFRDVVLSMQDRVSGGASLAEAMGEHGDVFDELAVSIARAGESAGTLDAALDRLAEFQERAAALRGRIGTALLYPAIVLLVTVGVCLMLMTFVVPKLLGPLVEAGQEVPLVTRIVKAVSDAVLGWWWLLPLLIAAGVAGTVATLRDPAGRRAWHRLQLRVPLLGEAVRKQAIVRIALVVSTLMRSGVVFVAALRVARDTTTNTVLRDALERCEEAVTGGADIAEALSGTGAFPPTVVQIFRVGQQSGRLEDVLDRLAADYDRQVATLTARLTAVLEPALILLMVVLVGFIAFATILPMLRAADTI